MIQACTPNPCNAPPQDRRQADRRAQTSDDVIDSLIAQRDELIRALQFMMDDGASRKAYLQAEAAIKKVTQCKH